MKGAVFALYSPVDESYVIPESGTEIEVETVIQRDEKSWYLAGFGTTDENGKLIWNNLNQESYYLLEVKAPIGYYFRNDGGRLLEAKRAEQGVYEITIVNDPFSNFNLPETGGMGVRMYPYCSVLLGSASVLMLYQAKKRKKRMESAL